MSSHVKNLAPVLLVYLLMLLPHVQAQTQETWLTVDGGYLEQQLRPLHLTSPVFRKSTGQTFGLGLFYDLGDSYHKGEVNYHLQRRSKLHPSRINASADQYASLALNYQYTHFYWHDIADLNLNFGSGPYLFVEDQTTDYPRGDDPDITSGSLLYGGGINVVLRYRHPQIPLSTGLHFINGGFLGSEEVDRQSDRYQSTSMNGWFSEVDLHVGYEVQSKWEIFLTYDWSEKLEYRSLISQRRTFEHLNLGISYRLEDD